MPRGFTLQEKEVIRGRLLQQGYRLFSSHGLGKTSIDDLAQAAGISKGAFYKFYDSKEALFMEIMEQVEVRVRREVLAVIDLPGPSGRARLLAALQKAFAVIRDLPILQVISGGDYELLFSRIPPDVLQQHLNADRIFIDELIARCGAAGIPICIEPERIIGLLYPLVFAILHHEDSGIRALPVDFDLLLELIAAYCVGDIEAGKPARKRPTRKSIKA